MGLEYSELSSYFATLSAKPPLPAPPTERDLVLPAVLILGGVFCVTSIIYRVIFLFHFVAPILQAGSAILVHFLLLIGYPLLGVAAGIWLMPALIKACLLWSGADYQPFSQTLESADDQDNCALCVKCRCITRSSRLLRGNIPWWRVGSVEQYDDFYDDKGLEKSAQRCHLCLLLWCSSPARVVGGDLGVQIRSSSSGTPSLHMTLCRRGAGLESWRSAPLQIEEVPSEFHLTCIVASVVRR